MKRITFHYRDDLSHGEWRIQQCIVSSVEECKRIYGLGTDPYCEYEILKVEDVDERSSL